jgi:spermine oxidase
VDSKIRFNKEVINIQWNPKWTIGQVILTCSDGQKYFADSVIFTGSLGVLKARHTSLFSPGLPDNFVTAIKNMGMGTIGKIFLEFDEPFWPVDDPKWIGYGLLWTPDDEKAVLNTDREW